MPFALVVIRTVIAAVVAKRRRIPLRRVAGIWIAPRRTSVVPAVVDETLPKLVWLIRNREPFHVRVLLLDGSLLSPANVASTAAMSVAFAGALIDSALQKGHQNDDLLAILLSEVADLSPVVPSTIDLDRVRGWYRQLTGGEISYRFRRAVEFDLSNLVALLALSSAAARVAGFGHRLILDRYADARDEFTHGGRIPAAWV